MENRAKTIETMLVLVGGFLAIHFWSGSLWWLRLAGIFAGIGIFSPRLSTWIHRGWMLLAMGLGWLNGRILLSLVFFLVVTPVALLTRSARIKGLALRKKNDPEGGYYTERDHLYGPKDLEQMW